MYRKHTVRITKLENINFPADFKKKSVVLPRFDLIKNKFMFKFGKENLYI